MRIFPKIIWLSYKEMEKQAEVSRLLKFKGTHASGFYDGNNIYLNEILKYMKLRIKVYVIFHEYLHTLKFKPLDDFIDYIDYCYNLKCGLRRRNNNEEKK